MTLKVQLNSFDALTKFLSSFSNEKEISIEIKDQILQKFSKEHLKPLFIEKIETTLLDFEKEVKSTLDKEVKSVADKVFDYQGYWSDKKYTLKSDLASKMKEEVRKCIDNTITVTIEKIVEDILNDSEKLKERVDKSVHYRLEKHVGDFVQLEIKKKQLEIQKMELELKALENVQNQ